MATRCFCPPDKCPPLGPTFVSYPYWGDSDIEGDSMGDNSDILVVSS